MDDWIETLFGQGSELTEVQMVLRAVAVFCIGIAMIRISGRRSFGQHRPFDFCTTVLLGAIMSRAIVGASPFWPIMCASLALVLLHRGVAIASSRWPRFEAFINGHQRELLKEGRPDPVEMRKALLTDQDLRDAIRRKTGDENTPIERAVLERDGTVSVQEPSTAAACTAEKNALSAGTALQQPISMAPAPLRARAQQAST